MQEQIPPKKRGGQPANTNAVKHGYYAATLHRQTLERLQLQPQPSGLEIEKQFLALLFKRIEKQLGPPLQECSPTNKYLHVLTLTLYILAHLLQTHRALPTVITPEVEIALAEVLDELFASP